MGEQRAGNPALRGQRQRAWGRDRAVGTGERAVQSEQQKRT